MWQSILYYGALALESVAGAFGIRLYEEPRYDVVERIGDRIEIRSYGPRLAAEVDLAAPGAAGQSEAFQLLFNYIAGANRAAAGSDAIAMTVPVEVAGANRKALVAMTVPVETSTDAAAPRMRFFLPAKYTIDTAPKPLNPRVRLVTVAGETIASLRYSGTGADREQRQADLVAQLGGTRWRPDGAPYSLFYDAPFTLPFLRRNEAAVRVTRAQG
jgi:hypothetical protein